MISLSRNKIESFRGNIIPLHLGFDVTETVGGFCGLEKYSGGKVTVGNIAIFK